MNLIKISDIDRYTRELKKTCRFVEKGITPIVVYQLPSNPQGWGDRLIDELEHEGWQCANLSMSCPNIVERVAAELGAPCRDSLIEVCLSTLPELEDEVIFLITDFNNRGLQKPDLFTQIAFVTLAQRHQDPDKRPKIGFVILGMFDVWSIKDDLSGDLQEAFEYVFWPSLSEVELLSIWQRCLVPYFLRWSSSPSLSSLSHLLKIQTGGHPEVLDAISQILLEQLTEVVELDHVTLWHLLEKAWDSLSLIDAMKESLGGISVEIRETPFFINNKPHPAENKEDSIRLLWRAGALVHHDGWFSISDLGKLALGIPVMDWKSCAVQRMAKRQLRFCLEVECAFRLQVVEMLEDLGISPWEIIDGMEQGRESLSDWVKRQQRLYEGIAEDDTGNPISIISLGHLVEVMGILKHRWNIGGQLKSQIQKLTKTRNLLAHGHIPKPEIIDQIVLLRNQLPALFHLDRGFFATEEAAG
jgi:hypothetical protein